MAIWDPEGDKRRAERLKVVTMANPSTAEMRSIADRLQRDLDALRSAIENREERDRLAATIADASAVLARSVEALKRDDPL